MFSLSIDVGWPLLFNRPLGTNGGGFLPEYAEFCIDLHVPQNFSTFGVVNCLSATQ
jgi:hypothetical protein